MSNSMGVYGVTHCGVPLESDLESRPIMALNQVFNFKLRVCFDLIKAFKIILIKAC